MAVVRSVGPGSGPRLSLALGQRSEAGSEVLIAEERPSIEPARHVLSQEVEGETVLLDSQEERYFVLDDVGTRVWQLLAEHRDVEVVVAQMLAEFEGEEATLRADIEELLGRLRAAGLVVSPP